MEEDAGKLMHDEFNPVSHVDLNRTGVPLIEIVSEPDIRGAEEAAAYLKRLHEILVYLEICDGNMEEGSFRCDANVSLRPKGSETFGTRAELKNMNSFRNVQRALEYEIKRQQYILEGGGTVVQETRLWDDTAGVSHPMRSKEEAHDYRYFPDPDLVPVVIDDAWVEALRLTLPELPLEKRERFVRDYQIPAYDAGVLTASRALADYYEEVVRLSAEPKIASNWVMGDVLRFLNEEKKEIGACPITPAALAELIGLIKEGTISGKMAKEVVEADVPDRRHPGGDHQGEGAHPDHRRGRPDRGDRRGHREEPRAACPVPSREGEGLRLLRRPGDEGDPGKGKPPAHQRPPEEDARGLKILLSMALEKKIRTVFWQDSAVVLIDQRALPLVERYVTCTDYRQVVAAIRDLTVRGAPAIGVAAAMGLALGACSIEAATSAAFRDAFAELCRQFGAARPTARNLFWAIERMQRCCEAALNALTDFGVSSGADPFGPLRERLVAEAVRIGEEDIAANCRLGQSGCGLIPDGARILTHCNAGALATAGYGTALGVIRAAVEEGKKVHVYADETRPVLQGARLTAWELVREGIPCTLITDNMAGFLMKKGEVDLVIVGADRIAANGDAANKIGTYSLAVLARAHGIPFYVAAPLSTIDPQLPDGEAIPIEERAADEVTHAGGTRTAPEGVAVWNPAFDVTPHDLITAIITEAGVIRPPFQEGIRRALSSPPSAPSR